MHRHLGRYLRVLSLIFVVTVLAGCAANNKIHNTSIVVQFSPDQMLHIAWIPVTLPDGSPPIKQRADLLRDVAEIAGGYTLIEGAVGGWQPPGQRTVESELNDLLLVKGPAPLALMLQQRLAQDFQQKQPFVVSIPVLPMSATVEDEQVQGAEEPSEAAGETVPD